MGSDSGATSAAGVQGYTRQALNDFLTAADAERARLRGLIEEARARTRRARTPRFDHRVLAAMLFEAQADVAEIRQTAEKKAAAILRGADEEAKALLDANRGLTDRQTTIDLPRAEVAIPEQEADGNGPAFSRSKMSVREDRYLAYLREGLADQEPLGPSSE